MSGGVRERVGKSGEGERAEESKIAAEERSKNGWQGETREKGLGGGRGSESTRLEISWLE